MLTQEILPKVTEFLLCIYVLSSVKNSASSDINQASDSHGIRIQVPGLVVYFTFFCIFFIIFYVFPSLFFYPHSSL